MVLLLTENNEEPSEPNRVPSIVVHNGSSSAPGRPAMEQSARAHRMLSKQAEFEELEQDDLHVNEEGDERAAVPPTPPRHAQSKVRLLVRSHAMREETSPPPDPVRAGRHKAHQQDSSTSSPSLSRDSSTEQYTDSTGVDLQHFITDTLNRNHKDRMLMLKIEQELVHLARDSKRSQHKFPQMSSYQRMLVHRVAAYFGMDHNVDQTGNAVIVNRTKSTRVPDTHFRDHIRDDLLFPEEPRRSILKRDSSSFEETCNFKSPERQFSSEARRSKSFEEREEEYEKARKRIFNREGGSRDSLQDDGLAWPEEAPWSSCDSDSCGLQATLQHLRPSRLVKVESFEGRDTLKANSLRLSVSKSYSFGGYPLSVLSRGDSCSSTQSAGARLLTKQDSGSSMSSRLSPSSSGYKSQSQRSDATMSATPSPSATPVSLAPPLSSDSSELSQAVMWAVTSMSAVPAGSVLINPQTGKPYTNADGSVYRFDPANPPKVVTQQEENEQESNDDKDEGEVQVGEGRMCALTEPLSSRGTAKPAVAVTVAPATNKAVSRVPYTSCTTAITTSPLPRMPLTPPCSVTTVTPNFHLPQQTPVLTICHSYIPNPTEHSQIQAVQQLGLNEPSSVVPNTAAVHLTNHTSNTNSSNTLNHTYPSSPAQFVSTRHGPEYMYNAQMVAPMQQALYTGYNMISVPAVSSAPSVEQRSADSSIVSVADLSGYLMGLGLAGPSAEPRADWVPHYISSARYWPQPAPSQAANVAPDCLALHTQPSLHMLYTPTLNSSGAAVNSATVPATQLPYYHNAAVGMAPGYLPPAATPPQTPTHNQGICNVSSHPLMYLNSSGFGPVYSGGTTGAPGHSHFLPGSLAPGLVSNLGLYRSGVQQMMSPPRPPHDNCVSKSTFSHSPPVAGGKEHNNHLDINSGGEKAAAVRYPPVPVFGLRIMPDPSKLWMKQETN